MPRPARVLIVDDEPDLRAMIVGMMDWQAGEFELAGQAIDGREALDFLGAHPVDLLITDLRMPVMTGLELLEAALPRYTGLRAVVLSAYDEFSLVKSAFKLGASDYLLKSELTAGAVAAVLTRLRGELEREEAAAAEATDDRQLCEAVLRAMVQGLSALPRDQLIRLADSRLMAGRGLVSQAGGSPESAGALESFRTELQQRFAGEEGRAAFWMTQRELAVLFRFPADVGWDEARRLPEALHAELAASAEARGLRYSLGLSGLSAAGGDPAGLHAQALAGLEATFMKGRGRLVHAGRLAGLQGRPRLEADRLAAGLAAVLDSGDAAELTAGRLGDFLIDEHCLDLADAAGLRELYGRYAFLLGLFARKRADPSLDAFMALLEDFTRELSGPGDLADCNRRLRAVFLELSTAATGRSPIVRRAVRHIHAHRSEALDLSSVAAALSVNPSYLSRSFSRELGRPFTDYVCEVKMRRAAELLRAGGLRVHEAAERLGYGNPEHFSRLFKKVMGRSPREYVSGC